MPSESFVQWRLPHMRTYASTDFPDGEEPSKIFFILINGSTYICVCVNVYIYIYMSTVLKTKTYISLQTSWRTMILIITLRDTESARKYIKFLKKCLIKMTIRAGVV